MQYETGLYFGLPEEAYHALPCLSASGVKNLLISRMDFWARSWMNPLREQVDSEAFKIGKAYHKRILEGRAAFESCYCGQFNPSDYPCALSTNDEIKAELRRRGLQVSGNKAELKARLVASDPSVEFLDDVYQQWRETVLDGREELDEQLISRIEVAAAMIEKHPELSKCFQGGYPEVSVVWVQDGITFKSRFDYLKIRAISDLKTFANMMNKPVEAAIYHAMAGEKYHIQAAMYDNAVKQAVKFAREGRVFGHVDPAWIKRFAQSKEHDFYFVFQQKGIAPVARGFKFPKGLMFGCGQQAIEDASRVFLDCIRTFGTDPWVDTTPIGEFDDGRFPIWATEL